VANSVRTTRGLVAKLGFVAIVAAGAAMLLSPVSAVAAQPQAVHKAIDSKAQRERHCRGGGSGFRWDSRANHGRGACYRTHPARQVPVPAPPAPKPPAPVSCEHRIPKCS